MTTGNPTPQDSKETAQPGSLHRLVRHPAYVLTVIFVVMPIIGSFMERGQVLLGLVLMAMQLPWAIQRVCELCDKDA